MAEFTVNTHRFDPYKTFKFRIKWDGQYVAGLQKATGLKKTTEMIEWREAGNPSIVRKMPGRTSFSPITFEAGVTHDTTFETWANQVNNFAGDSAISLVKYRKDITVELLNEQGTPVLRYTLHRAWVSEYQAIPDLDANSHAVAITSIKVEYEGFDRDTTLAEPGET